MVRSTYDANSDGIVDNATALGGQAASYYTNAGNLTGSVADARLSVTVTKLGQTIGTTEIEDGAVTVAKLAAGAATTDATKVAKVGDSMSGDLTLTGGASLKLATDTTAHGVSTWTSKSAGNNAVTVTNGSEVTFRKLTATTGFGSWVFSPEKIGRNFDLSFRLSGLSPLAPGERNIAIAIASDGTQSTANFDTLLLRHDTAASANNRVAISVAGGAASQALTSAAVPDFFDTNERSVLLQVRDKVYTLEVDGVVVHSFTASARTRATGIVGFAIAEASDIGTVVTVRDWRIIPRPSSATSEYALRITAAPTATANSGLVSIGSGPFDGTTAGYFGTGGSSNAQGTLLAGNTEVGFTGDLANLEVAGATKFKVDASGNLTIAGSFLGTVPLAAPGAIGATTPAAGSFTALSSSGYTQSAGNFSVAGAGTFSTGTGAISLNGDTTLAAGKNLSLASGAGTLTQTYTGTTGTAATFAADSLTSGAIMSLSSSSTAAAAGNTGLNIAISGANAAAGTTRYGLKSVMIASGATSTNVAGYLSATGATNNYGLIVENGNVGIGTASPGDKLHVFSSSVSPLIITAENTSPSGWAVTRVKSDVVINELGVSGSGAGSLAYVGPESNHALSIQTNNTGRIHILESGNVGVGTVTPGTGFDAGGSIAFSGAIDAAQIALDVVNYNPPNLSWAAVLRLTSDASRTISGLFGGIDGRTIILMNVGANDLILANESATSAAANRFALGGYNVTLAAGENATLWYDSSSVRWRLVNSTGLSANVGEWTVTGSDIYRSAGNVGIGTTAPLGILDVYGNSGTTTTTSTINAQGAAGTGNITVASSTGFPSSGVIVIDSEAITYSVVNSTTLDIVARAQLGTTGATHANASTVAFLETIVSKGASTTPHMVTTSAGRVGIGTESPSGRLHLKSEGGSTSPFYLSKNDNGYSASINLNASQAASLSLANSTSTVMVELNTQGDSFIGGGNLGIGTSAPQSLLDVSAATGSVISLSRDDTSVDLANSIGKIQFWNNDTQLATQKVYAEIEAVASQNITTDAAAGVLVFRTTSTTAAGSPVHRMMIDDAGKVTIGQGAGSPYAALTVLGGTSAIESTQNAGVFVVQGDVGGGSSMRAVFRDNTSNTEVEIGAHNGAGSDYGFIGTSSSDPFYLAAGNALQVRVEATGNVGIGTAGAGATKLDVNGQIRGGYVSHALANSNWLSGNIQVTSIAGGNTLTFTSGSMFDGASYVLILTATGTFTLSTAGDITTWKCLPACASNQITGSGHTVLRIVKAGATGYLAWDAGYQ